MNAIDLLQQDHRTVEGLFAQFEQASTPDRKREILNEIVRELSIHAAIEEELFYPVVKEVMPDQAGELVGDSLKEHHGMKQLLTEVDTADPDAPGLDDTIVRLKQDVEHHVRDEENEMMPQLRRRVPEELLLEVGRELKEAKGRAPTRPHPHAPDEPPALKLAAPLAALMDRFRDTIEGRKSA